MQVYFEEVHFFKNVRISIIKIGIARSNFSIRGVMKQYGKKGGCDDYRLVVYYAYLVKNDQNSHGSVTSLSV